MALTTQEEALVRQLIAENAELLNLAANEATIISKLAATKKNIGQLDSAASLSNTDVAVVRQGNADKQMALSLLKAFAKPDQATETTTGVIELATIAEVQSGTDTSRAITPAGLAANTATTSRSGVVELATTAEVLAGTDAARAATPAGLLAGLLGSGGTSASDYIKIPYRDKTSGVRREFIIQWGSTTADTDFPGGVVRASVTFPIPFTSAVFGIYPSIREMADGAAAGSTVTAAYRDPTLSGFTYVSTEYTNAVQSIRYSWIAIGY